MRVRNRSTHAPTALAAIAAVLLVAGAPIASASSHEESSVADEIKEAILSGNAYVRENLRDRPGDISQDGALQFWSSGGLVQKASAGDTVSEYDHFAITPKHIKVMELPGGEAAVAMYYSEGSMQIKGGKAVDHYMTRVLEVYVKEGGKWVVRAAHWSPIASGSGTAQTSVD